MIIRHIKWFFFFIISLFLIANNLVITEEPGPPAKNQGLSSQEKSEVDKLIKKYFESRDASEKQTLIGELTKYDDHISKNDLTTLTKTIWPLTKKGPKHDGKSPAQCIHPDYPGKYLISIPTSAKGGAKVGIFIALHGGGENVGDAKQIQGLFGMPNTKLIMVFPTVIKKEDSAWNTEREEQYVMEIIADLKRTYNIDTNQIYLAGHSMGGYGTWSIGTHYADVFAAISPMAGGIFTMRGSGDQTTLSSGTVANLKNTPIWFYHSSDDKQTSAKPDRRAAEMLKEYKEKYGPYDYVYKEYTDTGHGLPKEGLKPIWDWLFSKKRNPYPKFVIWEPSRSYKKIFYWLKLDNPGTGQRIEAKIEGNKISLQGNAEGLTIFLNEKLVNLTKPVIIEVNGTEKFNGLVSYSLGALVETIDDKKDPEMYFTSQVKIE